MPVLSQSMFVVKCEVLTNYYVFAIMYWDVNNEPVLETRTFKMGYYDRYIATIETDTEVCDLGITVNTDVYENGTLSITCSSTIIKNFKKETQDE